MVPIKSPSHDILSEAELLGPLGESTLQLRFHGPFEGRSVTWDATFCTLTACQLAHHPQQNFIEIGEEHAQGMSLTVGLNVSAIDAPTVRKTMMMIRQYKRLARGRHEFGTTRGTGRD